MRLTSNYDRFTHDQLHALDSRRNLAVRANAGSGKTSVLLERIVQLLAQSWDRRSPNGNPAFEIGNIVAVTFTRKAAAQLREGLRDSFAKMLEAAADQAERDFWLRQIQELPRASIATIDSLCARILRENGLDGSDRIEPDFELLAEQEETALRYEAVDRLVNRLGSLVSHEASDGDRQLRTDLDWWAKEEGYSTLTRHLTALLGHMVEPAVIAAAHCDPRPVAERVAEAFARLPSVAYLMKSRGRLLADLQALKTRLVDVRVSNQSLDRLGETIDSALADLQDQSPAAANRVLDWLRRSLMTQDKTPWKSGFNSILDIVGPIQDVWVPLLQDFEFDFASEVRAREAADWLARLLPAAYDEYLSLCRARGAYDFLTVARRTRDLLATSPEIRNQLKQRYRYVFVDEFQDTNQLQWEIISYLVGGGPDGSLDRDRLFIVGDPQQSIYRFRDADVSVFNRVQELIRNANMRHGSAELPTDYEERQELRFAPAGTDQRLGIMPLKENHRSLHPAPLLLVDRVMRHVFGKPIGDDGELPPFEVAYQELTPGLPPGADGEVCYIVPGDNESTYEPSEDDAARPNGVGGREETPLSELQVQCVVDQLVKLHGQPRFRPGERDSATLQFRDMAILLPSRGVVLANLEKELARRNVPYVVTKGVGFWQRQEVRDIVSLASCLSDPGDGLALLAVLRSPIGRLSDTEIFFLSQLGRGDLWRGLRFLAHVDDNLSGIVDGNDEPSWVENHWQQFDQGMEAALLEAWQGFSPPQRERFRDLYHALSDWRRRIDRMAHSDLLQRALEESDGLAVYASEPAGDVMLANLRLLFQHIREQETSAAVGMVRLARWLRDQVDDSHREEQATPSPDQDAVRIMTVHAAKGLEFPVVAVMKMERKASWSTGARLLVKNPLDRLLPEHRDEFSDVASGSLAVSVRHPDKPRELYTPRLLRALRRLEQAQELAESRRLFYVAATRAQERLILAGVEGKRHESWQLWFEEALGIEEQHKQQGSWEAATGLKVTIVTGQANMPPLPLPPPAALDCRISLTAIREAPKEPMLATTRLDEMLEDWRATPVDAWMKHRLGVLPRVPPIPQLEAEVPNENIGQIIGTLLHRLIEMRIDLREARQRELLEAMAGNLLANAAGSYGPTDDDTPAYSPTAVSQIVDGVETIMKKLHDSQPGARAVRKLLEAEGDAEVDFAVQLGRWHITGRFDKLIRVGDGFEIVDWKTDADDSAADIVKRYRPQMQLYALALYRAGKHVQIENAIRVHLALLHFPRVETLSFSLEDLETHARVVAGELGEMDTYEPVHKAAW